MIKQLHKFSSAALALALVLGISAPAHAQSINTTTTGQVGIDVGDDSSVDAGADASVGTAPDETTADDDRMSAGVSSGTDTGFSLTRSDASVTSSSGATVSASSVNTESDLEAYAASTLRANDSIDGVDVASDRLSLSFKEDARLFGFIPHTVTSRVEVSGDGSVRVMRPWYSFLVAGLSVDTKTTIESRVKSAMNEEASGSFSSRSQARVIAEIASALGSSVDAQASASVDMSANTDDATLNGNATSDTNGTVDVYPN